MCINTGSNWWLAMLGCKFKWPGKFASFLLSYVLELRIILLCLQLGDGTTTDRSIPPATDSDVLIGVAAIAAGPEHTCVLMLYGGVRCFGYNSYGELGNGAMYVDSNPVPSADVLFGAFGICAGYGYTAAILV